MLNQVLGALDELTPRRAGAEHFGEVGIVEDVAEKGLRVAGDPAVTLRNGTLGVDGDELAGAIFLPDTRQAGGKSGEMVDEAIERADGDAVGIAALHPNIEESPEEFAQSRLI